jgi:Leucine-rich repeat (LRR) protein
MLTNLRELNLLKNELEGPLPLAFSQLTSLTLLDLSGNGSLGTRVLSHKRRMHTYVYRSLSRPNNSTAITYTRATQVLSTRSCSPRYSR